ncbi:TIGR04086 family membrane protein [Paenibacillus sp. SC116]|uniref:TIGR04086 family membrane protein n=1 Tax=Paenibacillus sp. SC116 TaxID=2968986 RepID=UPI00215AE5BD|nr:TIGR04086 family membrane protein [Paenibacillus sp. SC116]MCR8846001.1 TIGR04086 family membrane protein [Paenibacillus sp. SC116]
MNAMQRFSSGKLSHPLLAGIGYAFLWLAIGALALSILLVATSTQEDNLTKYSYFVHGFALLIGGWTSGKRSGRKGWYYGGVTGILYALLVFVIGFLALDMQWDAIKWIALAAAFGLSALGGIFGVNVSKDSKSK